MTLAWRFGKRVAVGAAIHLYRNFPDAGQGIKTGVYGIRNNIDGKIYVGSAAKSFRLRWNVHRHLLRARRHDNRHLQAAWSRDGEAAFEFSVLMRCSPSWCVAMEYHQIQRMRAFDDKFGYNLSVPGKGMLGRKHSDETRAKLRCSHMGYVMPQSQKDRIGRAHRGKVTSEATKTKMRAACSSPEARERQRAIALAQWSDPILREKIVAARKAVRTIN